MGSVTAATIDANETYRLEEKVRTQISITAMAAAGMSAKITPIDVATPLPPRKPNQTGKLCPRTHATPPIIATSWIESEEPARVEIVWATTTAITPFKRSIRKTG